MEFFKLKEHGTSVKTELIAGLTTFMTMAYILAVNPGILSVCGMDAGGVFTATALSAFIATACMAFFANYPFALASGMGLNAYFAFTVAPEFGWQIALLAVFVEGIIFILLSFVNAREAIFNSIPQNMKYAVGVGIGLFICFIGFQNSGLIIGDGATLVKLGDLKSITVLFTIIGTIITVVLVQRNVKGALFIGIFATYLIGLVGEMTGLYIPNPEMGLYSLVPSAIVAMPPSIADVNLMTAFKSIDMSVISIFDFATVVFAFLFVDIFDTIGTLIGVSEKAGFLDKEGKLPKLKQALLADAVGTVVGAILGTSTVTTYVESASGVSDGGRTGLTALTTAFLFLIALFLWPIFSVIPSFATAPALIIVGLFMMSAVLKVNFHDYTEAFPAFLTIIMMPLAYSISEGLVFGVLSYVSIKLLSGKSKDITPVMYIIALLFLVKIIL